jgi:hypothetical protein
MSKKENKIIEEVPDNLDETQFNEDEILDDKCNEVIEIDEEDITSLEEVPDLEEDIDIELDLEVDKNEDSEEYLEDILVSKHTIEGKHSLKYDSIFKGKKEENLTEDDFDLIQLDEKFDVERSTQYWDESQNNENFIRNKRIKEKIYEVLLENTDINFFNNRRKPAKSDFNNYFQLLKIRLNQEKFSNIEIFNELAVYFSDNLFNMFKLLDNKWRNIIIAELQVHIGKQEISKEIEHRNISLSTELEFLWIDENYVDKLITGIVIEIDKDEHTYLVDSFERKYTITIDKITKILNNSKFRFNLNKLNNLDFI